MKTCPMFITLSVVLLMLLTVEVISAQDSKPQGEARVRMVLETAFT